MPFFDRVSVFRVAAMILGFILFFKPFQVANAQKAIKYNLGPQLMPLESTTGPGFDNPFPQSLVSNCNNSDFNYGNWTNWEGCYGTFQNSCEFLGFQELNPHPLHKIIPGPGYLDSNTCDSLLNVFPGESFVARLGDTIYYANGGSPPIPKAAELRYGVSVTSNSYLFIYRYAVVLQSGQHPAIIQPDFKVMITDADGMVLDST